MVSVSNMLTITVKYFCVCVSLKEKKKKVRNIKVQSDECMIHRTQIFVKYYNNQNTEWNFFYYNYSEHWEHVL